MKIIELIIEGVGGIKYLRLVPNSSVNLLCGPNGVGKTTILESISHIFSNGNSSVLKRNVGSEKSKIFIEVDLDGPRRSHTVEFDSFKPEVPTTISGLHEFANDVLSLKASRTFQYQPLESVNKDVNRERHVLWQDAFTGIRLDEIKNWFVNRYLYSAHLGALTEQQLTNFEFAKRCFSFLNPAFTFNRVDASSNEILLNTPNGEIYYEYLSSGFKSIVAILFGIIKEIEFRFKAPTIVAHEFSGIILIDEIELHLHPEWQERVVKVLREAFPMAQFFMSTHSPHVIQAAESSQIIALEFAGGDVIQRKLPNSPFGFQGWTVEEVLSDVMGMADLRTKLFKEKLEIFQKRVDQEDFDKASEVYAELDLLLHPENQLRKLLKFQLIGIGPANDKAE